MSRFENRCFVVTGGSSGIGLATAQGIANEGGRVLVTGTNTEKLAAAAQHPAIEILKNDAADFTQAAALAAEAARLFGRIDGAFLNAGKGGGAPLSAITPEIFRGLVDLNFGGPLFALQALDPLLNDGASVVITASSAKEQGFVGGAVYSGTKGAVRAMTRGLAREMIPRGIRVNCISPGPIDTPFFTRLGRSPEVIDQIRQGVVKSHPMGRFGQAEEVATVALFLLSEAASFVTGSDYPVDGGEAQL